MGPKVVGLDKYPQNLRHGGLDRCTIKQRNRLVFMSNQPHFEAGDSCSIKSCFCEYIPLRNGSCNERILEL